MADDLVARNADPDNRSVVRITLTRSGVEKLDRLSEAHLEELAHLAPTIQALWHALEHADGSPAHATLAKG